MVQLFKGKKYYWIGSLLVLFLLMFQNTVLALKVPAPPKAGNYVVDRSELLTKEEKGEINRLGRTLEQETTAELAVLVIPSLEGEVLEEYSLKVLRNWGIGKRDKNNGMLLLVATEDRKVRIEVGYGLEGAVSDAKAGDILANYAIPYFKKSEMSEGILYTYMAMVGAVASEYNVKIDGTENAVPYEQKESDIWDWDSPLVEFLLYLPYILLFLYLIVWFIFNPDEISKEDNSAKKTRGASGSDTDSDNDSDDDDDSDSGGGSGGGGGASSSW